jgi:hypothetical protein
VSRYGSLPYPGLTFQESVADPSRILMEMLKRPLSAPGSYRADCPCHRSGNDALTVTRGDDGMPAVHCAAGCASTQVFEALGLDPDNLLASLRRWYDTPAKPRAARASRDLAIEAGVVAAAADDIVAGKPLSPDALRRVHTAAARLRVAAR